MDMYRFVGSDSGNAMFGLHDAHSKLRVGLFWSDSWTGALGQTMPSPKFDVDEKIDVSREDDKQGYNMEHERVQGR